MRYSNRQKEKMFWKMQHPKHPKKKQDDLVAHFQKRCMQRIGIILDQSILKDLKQNNKLKLIEVESLSRKHYLLKREYYNGSQMLQFDVELVYNSQFKVFVTVWKCDKEIVLKTMDIDDWIKIDGFEKVET